AVDAQGAPPQLRLLRVGTGASLGSASAARGPVAFSPDGAWLAAPAPPLPDAPANDALRIQLWDVRGGTLHAGPALAVRGDEVKQLLFAGAGRRLLAVVDGPDALQAWEVATGRRV